MFFHRPTTLTEALDRMAESDPLRTRFYAGGVEVVFGLRTRTLTCDRLIDTKRIDGAIGVTRTPDHVRIGPATTHQPISRDAIVRTELPMLAAACSRLGTIQIRTRGTLGGNFSYGHQHTDPGTAALMYGGAVRLVSAAASRAVSLADFWLGPYQVASLPGELMESIEITPLGRGWVGAYDRFEQFHRPPTATMALAFRLDADGTVADCRLAVGGVPPRPMRLPDVEAELVGRDAQDVAGSMHDLESRLAPLVRAETDGLGSADFKVALLAGLVRRAARRSLER